MDIKKIYDKYHIPPNLQKHMLRVAALSQILIENWINQKLDKTSVTTACLFHDMANIIKYNFSNPPIFKREGQKTDYWKNIQESIIHKYGHDVYKATLTICHEIGMKNKIIHLVGKLEWSNSLNLIKENRFESMICIYSDMRIGPHGILSLRNRLKDLRSRNTSFDFEFTEKYAAALEKEIQKHISISVNSITDRELNERFEKLLKREV